MLVTASRSIGAEQLGQPAPVDLDRDHVDVAARPAAMASVEVPVPQPISSTTGADRPNHASVSIRAAGRPRCRAHLLPSSGHSRSQVSCWPPDSAERRERTTLVMRGKGW